MLTIMKSLLSSHLSTKTGLEPQKVFELLEIPKDSAHGNLAFPCFALAKAQKKSPQAIAQELSKDALPKGFQMAQNAGGYLNFFFDQHYWQTSLFNEFEVKASKIGELEVGKNQTIVIDYSSPNVAKPMSIGHLRSTVIGESLARIYRACGFKTVGINYIGDWGVQFGKLAWAHINLVKLLELAKKYRDQVIQKGFKQDYWDKLVKDAQGHNQKSFDYLFAVYVVFHALIEFEPALEDFGREYFLKLENRKKNKDELTQKIVKAWEDFIQISLVEYNRVYQILGTKHDLVRGESYYEDHLSAVIDELKAKKLLVESQGAEIVDLQSYDMPPCLIKKSDGATLYATRDIAAAINRVEEFKANRLIYVVGGEQSLHFKQFFKVLELMNYDWVKTCHHVSFGLYRFKEGKMSTRRGNVVLLEDVLDRAIEMVKDIIKEKNPDLKNADQVATEVGTGAVIFNDLMNDRQKNIDFDWDKLLDFNGDTGPYVQYSHVRCCSILNKWGKAVPKAKDLLTLEHPLEQNLINILGQFEDHLRLSYEQLKPSWMAQYSLTLAKAFNSFYYEIKILEGDLDKQNTRIFLVHCVRNILAKSLDLLSVRAPTAM